MVIIFSHPKVREFLIEHGLVYTYRKMHPKTPDGVRLQIGEDWATHKRGGKKLMDVYVTPMEAIMNPQNRYILRKYVDESGFNTTLEWCKAIQFLNPSYAVSGWIYKVEKR